MQDLSITAWRSVLLAIFLAALLVRIILVLTLQDGFYFVDAPIYSEAASHLLEHGVFPEKYGRAPLYPLFLAGIYWLTGEGVIFPRIVQATLGAIIAVLIAIIGKRAGGFAVGAVAGVLWSVYPMGVFIAGLNYPTTLVSILLAGGVLCLVSGLDQRGYWIKVALAGLLFGLAALAKPIVLVTIVFISMWLLLWLRSDRFQHTSIFLMVVVVVLSPWTARNYLKYDRLVPIEARGLEKVVPWAEKPADQDNVENKTLIRINRLVERFPREFITFFELYPRRVNFLKQENRDKVHRKNPRFVQYTTLGTNRVVTVSIVSVGLLYLFALIGIAAMWQDKDKKRELSLYVLMVMSFALGYAISWGKIRYRIPVDPYIIILSAWGVMYVWDIWVKRHRMSS